MSDRKEGRKEHQKSADVVPSHRSANWCQGGGGVQIAGGEDEEDGKKDKRKKKKKKEGGEKLVTRKPKRGRNPPVACGA